MKKTVMVIAVLASLNLYAGWQSQLGGILGGLGSGDQSENSNKSSSSNQTKKVNLTNMDMNKALKEALKEGVKFAVKSLGKEGGYYDNPLVKIPLPKSMEKSASIIKKFGGEKYIEDLELSMNKAAQKSAPKTAKIFMDSIKDMSIEDAKKILAGNEHSATDYFREKTTKKLTSMIKPIVKESMKENGVYKYYGLFNSYYKKYSNSSAIQTASNLSKQFGFGDYLPSTSEENLDDYVTKKAIDGLMNMIAQKEKDIRANPLMQHSDIVKNVFSLF